MAKTLSSILNQIERLQKEAASIQSEVIDRIRKEIAKYGLTAEQLFGESSRRRGGARSTTNKSDKARAAKYADGTGNTWGGRGKRPDWLRHALDAGRTLEEFLVAGAGGATPQPAATRKRAAKAKGAAASQAAAPVKKRLTRKSASRKPRAKPAAASASS